MSSIRPWLSFFRVGNLITVPGDALVGAVAVAGISGLVDGVVPALASVAIYMFGLADNDIVGVASDPSERPLVNGTLSMRAAKVARGLCLLVPLVLGAAFSLPPLWWITVLILIDEIVVYNRTKSCLRMGLCRGLNVFAGGAALYPRPDPVSLTITFPYALMVLSVIWTAYIAGVTKYSEREVFDSTNQRKVALLVYGLLILQLTALILISALPSPLHLPL